MSGDSIESALQEYLEGKKTPEAMLAQVTFYLVRTDETWRNAWHHCCQVLSLPRPSLSRGSVRDFALFAHFFTPNRKARRAEFELAMSLHRGHSDLADELLAQPAPWRRKLVEQKPRRWGVTGLFLELLLRASLSAPRRPQEGLELVELAELVLRQAVRVGDAARDSPSDRQDLEAQLRACRAEVLAASGQLAAAQAQLEAGAALLQKGTGGFLVRAREALSRAAVLEAQGDFAAALATLAQAEGWYFDAGSYLEAALCVTERARLLRATGEAALAAAELRSVLEVIDFEQAPELRPGLLVNLARYLLEAGEVDEARPVLGDLDAYASWSRELQAERWQVAALQARAEHDPEAAREALSKAAASAQRSGQDWQCLQVLLLRIDLCRWLGRPREVALLAAEGECLLARQGAPEPLRLAWLGLPAAAEAGHLSADDVHRLILATERAERYRGAPWHAPVSLPGFGEGAVEPSGVV